jgi:hypothetical protein
VNLVGFIIRIYHDVRSSECQKKGIFTFFLLQDVNYEACDGINSCVIFN